MHRSPRLGALGAAVATALTAPACTSLLGDIDFKGSGAGGSTTASTAGTGGAGGATTTTGAGGASVSTGTGGGGGGSCALACDPLATCEGGSCICPSGYKDENGNGTKCSDIDECGPSGGNTCSTNATCVNTAGGYSCVCDPGYAGATCDTCVRFVDAAAAGAKNGLSWAGAFKGVQQAIDAADVAISGEPACEVWVKQGTYYLYASSPDDGLALHSNTALHGGFAGGESDRAAADPAAHPTLLDGREGPVGDSHVRHVIRGYQVTGASVDGFILQGGDASTNSIDASGGGFLLATFNQPTSATLSRCEIRDNHAQEFGGGLATSSMGGDISLVVSDCNIHHNTATADGGGVIGGGHFTMQRTTIADNHAHNGGGLLVSGDLLVLDQLSILRNVSEFDAGGMRLLGGGTLTNLIFAENLSGGIGGGLLTSGATLSNALFAGNFAAGAGGAIYHQGPGALDCTNCTITGNDATNQGDGIFWDASGALTLTNSIVWGNPGPLVAGTDVDPPSWAVVSTFHCDIRGYTGSDGTTFNKDPSFVSAPVFFDHSTGPSAAKNSLQVKSGALYSMGDKIEIAGDGVERTVLQISGNTVPFSPPLADLAPASTPVRNYGGSFGSFDFNLAAGSKCIDQGDAAAAPETDLAGKARVGAPDIGAYEHQ